MSVMVILVAFSILVAAGFLVAFLWAVKSGQYDDRHTPAMRMLFEDRPVGSPKKETSQQNKKTMKSDTKAKTEEEPDLNRPAGSVVTLMREEENRYGS